MKRVIKVVVSLFLININSFTLTTMCIMDFNGKGWLSIAIPDMIREYYTRGSDITIVERSIIKKIIEEHKLSLLGLDKHGILKFGRILPARYMLYGNIYKNHGNFAYITLVDNQTTRILLSKTYKINILKIQDNIDNIIKDINEKLYIEGTEFKIKAKAKALKNFYIALRYIDRGNYRRAIINLNKAIKIDPSFASAYNNIGYIYTTLGNIKKAIFFFNKAIRLDPTLDRAYFNLALTKRMQGDINGAITLMLKAIDINESLDYLVNIGGLFIEKGDIKSAMEYLQKALEYNIYTRELLNNIALAYYKLKDYKKAIFFYKKLIKLDKYNYRAYINLMSIYFQKGDKKNTINIINKAKKTFKDNYHVLYNSANYLARLGMYKRAIRLLKKAIAINKNADASYLILLCYYKLRDKKSAKPYLKTLILLDNGKYTQQIKLFKSWIGM